MSVTPAIPWSAADFAACLRAAAAARPPARRSPRTPPAHPSARTHVALIERRHAAALLAGIKRAECRLSRYNIAPYGRVAPGDVVYSKVIGAGFALRARVTRVLSSHADAAQVLAWAKQYEPDVRGGFTFWSGRLRCHFATLMWVDNVQPWTAPPRRKWRTPGARHAWYVLPAPKPARKHAPRAVS